MMNTDHKRGLMSAIFVFAATVGAMCVVLGTGPAKAEMSSTEWLAQHRNGNAGSRQLIEEITRATVNGRGWYAARSKVKLYCEPPRMAFTGSQLLDVLQRSSDESTKIAGYPWSMALLLSLEATFPCEPQGHR